MIKCIYYNICFSKILVGDFFLPRTILWRQSWGWLIVQGSLQPKWTQTLKHGQWKWREDPEQGHCNEKISRFRISLRGHHSRSRYFRGATVWHIHVFPHILWYWIFFYYNIICDIDRYFVFLYYTLVKVRHLCYWYPSKI